MGQKLPLQIRDVMTTIRRDVVCLHRIPMSSVYTLIFCILLLQSDGTVTPNSQDRLRAVQTTEFVPNVPTAVPTQTVQNATLPIAPTPSNAKQARFVNGLSMPKRDSHVVLSAAEKAVLMSLTTERRDVAGNIIQDSNGNPVMVPLARGMGVFQGQVLGKFDDRELHSILQNYQTQLEVAKAEREKEIEIVYAANGVRVAIANLQMMLDANERHPGTFPAMEVMRAQLEKAQADAYLDLQKYNIDVIATAKVTAQESEVDRVKVQIGLRQLVAPIDGVIVKIEAAEGERLREGDPVLEIMRLDTLWVRVQANINEYTHGDLDGKQAAVRVLLPGGRTETFQGAVVYCNPKVEAAVTFDVFVEVQNRRSGNFWLLQPGRGDVDVVIML